jgi:methionyl-tRNA formyltransferase
MKITLFTANQGRHNYFINLLSTICNELYVVQEAKKTFTKIVTENYIINPIIEKYFENVTNAQNKIFGNPYVNRFGKNIKIFSIQFGDLNNCSADMLNDFLKSDYYIVFGASYIKGDLANFLISKNAINIHMGVSPYYRGTDCNFWALYDDNPHLVGATIHLLSKGLDNGPILYHAMSNIKTSPFEYTMSATKSALYSVVERIKKNSILKFKFHEQNKKNEIRYSKKKDFNEKVASEFLNRKINLNSKLIDENLLIKPFFIDS